MKSHRAILSAVVVGYSRLIRVEPSLTRTALDDIHSELMQPALSRFGGRILDSVDERTSIEFNAPKQAVLFAISLQLSARNRNRDIREDRQIQYRIGIESVTANANAAEKDAAENIATELSELVEAGRICISGTVRQDIADQLELTIQPIEGLRFMPPPSGVAPNEIKLDASAGAAMAAAEKPLWLNRRSTVLGAVLAVLVMLVAGALFIYPMMTRQPPANSVQTLPQKPSIAVMPFENLSTSTEGSMFAHGITASIISALAQVPQLFVISSSSAFSFAKQFGGTREVGAEFGVRYVLVGSVQVSGNNIRVIAELSDTKTGETLWTERYDRNKDNVFAVQDEITLNVLVSLQVALTEGRRAAIRGLGTNNVAAYLGLLKAEAEFKNYSRSSMAETRRILQAVRALDPNYYHALLLEARTHTFDAQWGYSDDPKASLQFAAELLQEAALLDGDMSEADRAEVQVAQAYLDQMSGNYDKAVENAFRAAETSPNNANVLSLAGWVVSFDRHYRRSNALLTSAIAHNPIYPSWYANFLSRNHAFTSQTEAAIRWAKEGIKRAENDRRRAWALVNLVFAQMEAGDTNSARTAANEALELWPDLTLATLERAQPFQYEEDWQRFKSAMLANGVPE